VYARLERAAVGDWKTVGGAKGIFEMRIHHAQGYRIFYAIVGQTVVLLLAGSTKQEQDRTISKAKEYLAEYKKRVKP
jgi:putative addiction module killer protein